MFRIQEIEQFKFRKTIFKAVEIKRMAALSFLQKGTRISRNQLNLIDLFNVKDTLKQRGFDVIDECTLEDTLLNSRENTIFKNPYYEGKDDVLKFLDLFSEKSFRANIRSQVYGEKIDASLFNGISFRASVKNQQRFSKTVELLLAYQCVQNLSAFSASFGIKIKEAPEGGDFDCLANFQTSLFHFEIKSGNIKNISNQELQHFLRRHDFLCPEASVLFLDYNKINDDFICQFLGLEISGLRRVEKILKISDQGQKLFMIEPGVIVVDVANNGNILQNIQFAMKFLDRYKTFNRSVSYGIMQPEYLGLKGEILQ